MSEVRTSTHATTFHHPASQNGQVTVILIALDAHDDKGDVGSL